MALSKHDFRQAKILGILKIIRKNKKVFIKKLPLMASINEPWATKEMTTEIIEDLKALELIDIDSEGFITERGNSFDEMIGSEF